MGRIIKYLLIVVFLIPVENYSQFNSSVNVNKNNSVTDGFVPIDGRFNVKLKNGFDSEIYARMNTKSEVKYLEVTFKDMVEVGSVEVNYQYLISSNTDPNFHIAEDLPVKGFNKNNTLIFESKDWEVIDLYSSRSNDLENITKLEIPIYFKTKRKGGVSGNIIIGSQMRNGNYISPGIVRLYGTSFIPKIELNNFTFEPQKINSGISKQKGAIRIESKLLSSEEDSSKAEINIKSLKIDPNSPDKHLFSSFRVLDSEYEYDEYNGKKTTTGKTLSIEFELNTDLAVTTGTKFARLVVVSDAAPANEDGELKLVENSYQFNFNGEFYKDNHSALNNGGYIQVEIIEDTQSSVEELTENDVKILNPQPINGSELNLEINHYQGAVITLTDIEGNMIKKINSNNNQVSVDISGLSSGVYFINISDGKSQITKKFMIER